MDDADLVVVPFGKSERDFVFRFAVCGDAVLVTLDHLGEFLVWRKTLPAKA